VSCASVITPTTDRYQPSGSFYLISFSLSIPCSRSLAAALRQTELKRKLLFLALEFMGNWAQEIILVLYV
jgi:hypothetical protein